MAITCKWENNLGKAKLKFADGTHTIIDIYGGGNCIAVFCDKDKNLYHFFIDKEHIKNIAKNNNGNIVENLVDIQIFNYKNKWLKKEVENFVKILLQYEVEFKVVNKGIKIK